ncbi:MAG: EamA family transporter [Denitromonas halophila]|nr:MAG: EamA family transporter [Denitromonas halophila]
MSLEALMLVIAGAVLHAVWNLSAKRAAGGVVFVWAFNMVSVLVTAPIAAWLWLDLPQALSAHAWLAISASAVVHIVYNLVLLRGYRVGEFSVVYPVARGSGPMFAVLGALLWFGENPSLVGWLGIGAVLAGLFLIGGVVRTVVASPGLLPGIHWGLMTGVCIAGYTLIDAWAVKAIGVPVILYYSLGLMVRTVFLAPQMLARRAVFRAEVRRNLRHIVMIGVLSPAAYLLVLQAMTMAPLSYVAPVREVSMLIGVLIGARVLREAVSASRLAGAGLMVAGVVLLGLA